jgi:hypothetical protein
MTSIIGTSKNAPAAPTIPEPIPTKKASPAASHLLKTSLLSGLQSYPIPIKTQQKNTEVFFGVS